MKDFVIFPIPLLALVLGSASVQAATLIYEPFADSDSTLPGNASGLGLDGNWAGSGDIGVTTGSMSWGDLATSGNQTTKTNSTGFRSATVGTGTTLSGGGHLDNGAVLWFSFLAESVASGRTYMTIGTGGPDGFDRIGGVGGFGLGVRLENGSVFAHGWDNNTAVKPTGATVSAGTVFVVGRITWAASGNNDTLDIFLPGTDLVLPGTAASTLTRDFDQSTFTTLGIAGGASASTVRVDEIRFGTSYADVSPIPEPSTALIGGLGLLALLRRRR